MIWQQMKTQLKDEFDENTRLLTMYNLIGLSEHDNDNDHHHYKKNCLYTLYNNCSKTFTKQIHD